jgi:hypothetical protein
MEVTNGDYVTGVERMAGRYLFVADDGAEGTSEVFDRGIGLKDESRVVA